MYYYFTELEPRKNRSVGKNQNSKHSYL